MNGRYSYYQNIKLLFLLVVIVGGLSLLSGCNTPAAQNSPEVYRIGLLAAVDIFNTSLEGFQAEMEELGYVEGENIIYDFQRADSDPEKMQEIANQFVIDQVDLIVSTTNGGAVAAQKAVEGTDIPVVFTMVLDPIEIGLVEDVAHPEGNVTGVSIPLEEFIGKRLDILKQMAPSVEKIWVPHDPTYSAAIIGLESLNNAKDAVGIELIEAPFSSPEELIAALEEYDAMDEPAFDAIHIMPDNVVQNPASIEAILAFGTKHNIPVVANVPPQTQLGALFSYMPDNFETGRLAGPLADKILKGAAVSSVPVVPTEPRMVINYQTAQALELDIQEGLLAQAVEIIR